MITLENTQSDLDTQRLAVIWMRDHNLNELLIIDPAFATLFELNGNKLTIASRI